MIELGQSSQRIHKKIGEKIGEVCDLAILVTKDHIDDIREGAIQKGFDPGNIKYIKELDNGINFKEGVILLEGRIPEDIKKRLNLDYSKDEK